MPSGIKLDTVAGDMTTRIGQVINIDTLGAIGLKGTRTTRDLDVVEKELREYLASNPSVTSTATTEAPAKAAAPKKTPAKKAAAKPAKSTASARLEKATEAAAEEGKTKARQSRKRTGRAIQDRRRSARAPRDVRILAGDTKILEEVQAWVDEQRKPLPKGWKPKNQRRGDKQGEVAYEAPSGWVSIPATEFARMQKGTASWRDAEPPLAERKVQAKKLKNLSFQPQECRFCRREIKDQHSPELSQIWQLLRGYFVLPYINHPLVGNQSELRFRRMHLPCSLLEDKLANLLINGDPDLDLAKALAEAVDGVLILAQEKVAETTEDDIFEALDAALAYIEKEAS